MESKIGRASPHSEWRRQLPGASCLALQGSAHQALGGDLAGRGSEKTQLKENNWASVPVILCQQPGEESDGDKGRMEK